MTVPSLHSGRLPEGRWVCTPAEVEAAFVTPGDPREAIWQDWLLLTGMLQRIVGHLPSAWVSGSFFTDKPKPGDMDCVYVIDTDDFRRAITKGDADSKVLWTIAQNRTKTDLHLNVDSFVLEWFPTPTAGKTSPPDYYENRGYWDDLWVRERDADPRIEAIPRRGYLEVMLDGYR